MSSGACGRSIEFFTKHGRMHLWEVERQLFKDRGLDWAKYQHAVNDAETIMNQVRENLERFIWHNNGEIEYKKEHDDRLRDTRCSSDDCEECYPK